MGHEGDGIQLRLSRDRVEELFPCGVYRRILRESHVTAGDHVTKMRKYFDLLFGQQLGALLSDDVDWFVVLTRAFGTLVTRSDEERALISVSLLDHQSQALLR